MSCLLSIWSYSWLLLDKFLNKLNSTTLSVGYTFTALSIIQRELVVCFLVFFSHNCTECTTDGAPDWTKEQKEQPVYGLAFQSCLTYSAQVYLYLPFANRWLENVCYCVDWALVGSLSVAHCGLAGETTVRDHDPSHGFVLIIYRSFVNHRLSWKKKIIHKEPGSSLAATDLSNIGPVMFYKLPISSQWQFCLETKVRVCIL